MMVGEREETELVVGDIREESGRVTGGAQNYAGVMIGFEEGIGVPGDTDKGIELELEGRETGHCAGRTVGGIMVSTGEAEETTWGSTGKAWERTRSVTGEAGERIMGTTGETGKRTGGATEGVGERAGGTTGDTAE